MSTALLEFVQAPLSFEQLSQGEGSRSQSHLANITIIDFNDKAVVLGKFAGIIEINYKNGKVVEFSSEDAINCLCLSGDRLLSGDISGNLTMWDLSSFKKSFSLKLAEPAADFVHLPGSYWVTFTMTGSVCIFENENLISNQRAISFGFSRAVYSSQVNGIIAGSPTGHLSFFSLSGTTIALRHTWFPHRNEICAILPISNDKIVSLARDGGAMLSSCTRGCSLVSVLPPGSCFPSRSIMSEGTIIRFLSTDTKTVISVSLEEVEDRLRESRSLRLIELIARTPIAKAGKAVKAKGKKK